MGIMQQSSNAQDRTLGVWFENIREGRIKLPRFQRYEAWDRHRITSLLNTIISNLPVGVTLVLDVAGDEQFISRFIESAEPQAEGTVLEHLLDGQQRLTAFWRSMHNNYESDIYFVYLPQYDEYYDEPGEDIEVYCIGRWTAKNGSRRPVWVDHPEKCLQRGFFPISLLCPGDKSSEVDAWISKATKGLEPNKNDPDAYDKLLAHTQKKDELKDEIIQLRERVAHFNLPYLALPASTPKDVALQVFINMNTNSKPLSLYDIIVAEVESVAGKSLHDLEAHLINKCPKATRFGDVRNLILATSALLQEKIPHNRGMLEMDKQVLLDNWNKLEVGLERMANLLEAQGIFDAARLPTNAVLAVIAAAYELVPEDGDFAAKADELLRAYLWSSFLTDRYENSAATRAYADFKGIKDKHRGLKDFLGDEDFDKKDLEEIPVFNRDKHELTNVDSLITAGWPKKMDITARGILAVSNYFGARDFADNKQISYDSIQAREYHHIFPEALLSEAELNGHLALNCALITWKTNRVIGRKDPLDYLRERVQWADESIVLDRLKTHLIPYDLLSRAQYQGLNNDNLKTKLEADFNQFVRTRAELVYQTMTKLASGEQPSLDSIWSTQP
ncbi:MAG: DUF262 domain-containing protein [Gammaproteobacteria bacterium]|nr:DUF262 domain-containing protein [Gammaproteobacteria bacterium]